MIIKINFSNGLSMLFGNSYKNHDEQVAEYMQIFAKDLSSTKIESAQKSRSKWIQNGIKWCCFENFQNELDRENKSRKVGDIYFEEIDNKTFKKIIEFYNKGQRFLKIRNMTDQEYKDYKNGTIKL